MESTSWYDSSGSRKDVNGTEVPAIPRVNPTVSQVYKSAGKFSNKTLLEDTAHEYHAKTGNFPSKVYSPESSGCLKGFSLRVGGKLLFLEVVYGSKEYKAT